MFYRIDENGQIIDCADFQYTDDCLKTDKKIIRGFDGVLRFEEETQTEAYQQAETKVKEQLQKVKRIDELKQLLKNSDYKAIKYAEGELTEVEYAETKAQRKAWRAEINVLEENNAAETEF